MLAAYPYLCTNTDATKGAMERSGSCRLVLSSASFKYQVSMLECCSPAFRHYSHLWLDLEYGHTHYGHVDHNPRRYCTISCLTCTTRPHIQPNQHTTKSSVLFLVLRSCRARMSWTRCMCDATYHTKPYDVVAHISIFSFLVCCARVRARARGCAVAW